jgi:pimeloyl-ACP methyl ester carboxylesterase
MKAPLRLRAAFAVLGRLSPRHTAEYAANIFSTPRVVRRPKWEVALLARGRTIALDSGLSATEWGASDGMPVILLHGWEGRGAQLGFFVDPLVALGHRVIALDGPAHGASPGKRSSPVDFARALLAVSEQLGPLHTVIGHSMGARAAIIALGWGLETKKLVLLGTPAAFEEVVEKFSNFLGLPTRMRGHLKTTLQRRANVPPEQMHLQTIASKQSLPVLVVHDVRDLVVPVAAGREAARAFRHATYLEVDSGGHRKMLKAPSVLAAVAAFVGPLRG